MPGGVVSWTSTLCDVGRLLKLATNSSFHLVLKGIPDTTMKRPCSGYRGSRHTDDSMVGLVTRQGDNDRQYGESNIEYEQC